MSLTNSTPITYANSSVPLTWGQWLLEKVDHYFYLGGKKAYVINITDQQEEIVLSEGRSSEITNFAKRISYYTLVIPWAMSLIQKELRSRHTFTIIDPKAKLEEGLFIPKEVIRRLENEEFDSRVIYLQKCDRNVVFKFKGFKLLVIKKATPAAIEERYENMACGKAACLAHRLNNLFIPPAKIYTTKTSKKYLIEQAVEFNHAVGAQEELYLNQDSSARIETIRQFAIFIAVTKYCDVIFRNTPFIKESNQIKPYRIALFDLEHMIDALAGFEGSSNGSIGLLNCVAKEQIEVVVNVARQYGIHITEEIIQYRLQKLKEIENLRKFHANKNIQNGKERLNIKLDELGLNLEETITCQPRGRDSITFSLRQFAEVVTNKIENSIQKSSQDGSVSAQRHVVLDFNNGGPDSMNEWTISGIFRRRTETEPSWLEKILETLKEKGHIFSHNQKGYTIDVHA